MSLTTFLALNVLNALIESENIEYSSWTQHCCLPRSAVGMALGYDNQSNNIWLLGGDNSNAQQLLSFSNGVFIDHGNNNLSVPIQGNQYYTQIDDILWIMQTNSLKSYLYTFDIKKPKMDVHISMPNLSVTGSCLTSFKNEDLDYLAVVNVLYLHLFNISSDTWISSNLPILNQQRSEPACIVHNQKLYAIGGASDNSVSDSSRVELLSISSLIDIKNEQWVYLTDSLLQPGQGVKAIIYNNDILVIGGTSSAGQASDAISLIDTTTNSIKYAGHLAFGVHDCSLVIVYKNLYVFGGSDGAAWQSFLFPTVAPTTAPTAVPSSTPTEKTIGPTSQTLTPTESPTVSPTIPPTVHTMYPSSTPSESPTSSPTKNPTQNEWINKNSQFCKDGYTDLSANNSLYRVYCQPCPDNTAGRYGQCHECESPAKPNEERTECKDAGSNNHIKSGIKITFQTYLFTVFVLLGVVTITSIVGLFHSRYDKYQFDWKALFTFLIYLFDAESDLFFCINLYSHYSDANDTIYLLLFILSLLFLLLPSFISVYGMEKIISSLIETNNITTIKYFGKYSFKLYITCFIIGNFTATLKLFGCNLMNLNVFKLSIPMSQMLLLENKHFIYNVLSESVPQLIISVSYSIYSKNIFYSDVVLFTYIFGIISLITSAFVYRTNKRLLKNNKINEIDDQYQILENDHIDGNDGQL